MGNVTIKSRSLKTFLRLASHSQLDAKVVFFDAAFAFAFALALAITLPPAVSTTSVAAETKISRLITNRPDTLQLSHTGRAVDGLMISFPDDGSKAWNLLYVDVNQYRVAVFNFHAHHDNTRMDIRITDLIGFQQSLFGS
jgi:hypothetical protein